MNIEKMEIKARLVKKIEEPNQVTLIFRSNTGKFWVETDPSNAKKFVVDCEYRITIDEL